MAGIVIRNKDGNVSISSDNPTYNYYFKTDIGGNFAPGEGDGAGDDFMPSPFTGGVRYGSFNSYSGSSAIRQYAYTDEYSNLSQLIWFNLFDGFEAAPGGYFQRDSGALLFTKQAIPEKGKYLNVYDANGTLIWTAESCATMPRIIGELFIPPDINLNSEISFYNIPKDIYFLVSPFYCDSDSSDASTIYIAFCIKREGEKIRFIFSSKDLSGGSMGVPFGSFKDIYPDGLYIPYAIINV
ncbi:MULTISPECIES: hypothetical protein [unclassified Tatumella]|uniref:hypothetical protein n=1 Tax=unclassified Tatumella TaxID=2649542 RepID=UPI001BAEF304|nr:MULTISPECIES: hypothetical protein [unclassified Tatumella]MBS0855999.1 hypothetical protein [Tatumella sp. JGM16]MBS0912978.1 hypothetical protein [Tatumella sp. JGM91]